MTMMMTDCVQSDNDDVLTDVELVLEIVAKFVTKPEQVKVSVVTQDRVMKFTITTAIEDRGRVIGKNGSRIDLIRKLLEQMNAMQRVRIDIQMAKLPENVSQNAA